MAIRTSFQDVQSKFNKQYWSSIDEFEDYYLQRISETTADTNYYTDRDGTEREIGFVNHHPQLKEYEVWSEGYAATGERGYAHLLGKAFARNWAQACDIVMCQSHLKWIEKVNDPDWKDYCPPSKWTYDPHKLSNWAMNLYWCENHARKSFG